jgi:hypothetical protein
MAKSPDSRGARLRTAQRDGPGRPGPIFRVHAHAGARLLAALCSSGSVRGSAVSHRSMPALSPFRGRAQLSDRFGDASIVPIAGAGQSGPPRSRSPARQDLLPGRDGPPVLLIGRPAWRGRQVTLGGLLAGRDPSGQGPALGSNSSGLSTYPAEGRIREIRSARRCWAPPLTGDHARLPPRPPAPEQRRAVPR